MKSGPTQSLSQILFSQGFGTRRHCAAMIADGQVQIGGVTALDADQGFPTAGLVLTVDGQPWPYYEKALVLLHKPAGYECSTKPKHHPGVLMLLPPPLRERGVQPVGRLDADTTGALLLTDDGPLLHRLTSPKHRVEKVYEVSCKLPVSSDAISRLLAGVMLDGDPRPAVAVACTGTGEFSLRMTLTEGRYHQVKRMLVAVGNEVQTLHRSAVGALTLAGGPAHGQWRFVDQLERAALLTHPAG